MTSPLGLEMTLSSRHAREARAAALDVLIGRTGAKSSLLCQRGVRRDLATMLLLRGLQRQMRMEGVFVPWADLRAGLEPQQPLF